MSTPGWYPDPSNAEQELYWDGQRWHGVRSVVSSSGSADTSSSSPAPVPEARAEQDPEAASLAKEITSAEALRFVLPDRDLRADLGIYLTDKEASATLADKAALEALFVKWSADQGREVIEPQVRGGCGLGCLVIVGIFIVGAVIFGIVSAVTSANRAPVYDEVSAYTHCQIAVKDLLVSPATAQFSQMSASGSGGTWTARGVVDSQNQLGATVRSSFECSIVDGERIKVNYLQ
jgi:hypothetical protein